MRVSPNTDLVIPDAPWCWYIYLQNWVIFRAHVGKYSSTMEHLGMVFFSSLRCWDIFKDQRKKSDDPQRKSWTVAIGTLGISTSTSQTMNFNNSYKTGNMNDIYIVLLYDFWINYTSSLIESKPFGCPLADHHYIDVAVRSLLIHC